MEGVYMANFSDFVNQDNDKKIDNKKTKTNEKVSEDDLKKMVDKYSGLSNDELMKEFVRLTTEKKRNGELGRGELSNIKNTIMPYLDEKQKSKLNSIIDMVDNV